MTGQQVEGTRLGWDWAPRRMQLRQGSSSWESRRPQYSLGSSSRGPSSILPKEGEHSPAGLGARKRLIAAKATQDFTPPFSQSQRPALLLQQPNSPPSPPLCASPSSAPSGAWHPEVRLIHTQSPPCALDPHPACIWAQSHVGLGNKEASLRTAARQGCGRRLRCWVIGGN